MSLFSIINQAIRQNLTKSGVIELSSHYIMPAALTGQGLIIDLGANTGRFYEHFLSIYNCSCIAVEASPKLYHKLPDTEQVSKFNYAITSTDGPVSFFLSDNQEASSLKEVIAEPWGISEKVTVEGITFENFLKKHHLFQKILLLKVDIEGAELDLIEDASSETLKRINQIAIEFHDFLDKQEEYIQRMQTAIKKLEKHNFLILKISNHDYREVLCINTANVKLNYRQKFRLKVMHKLLQILKKSHSVLAKLIR